MTSVLVTVGSTSFPALTDFIALPTTRAALSSQGVSRLILQHGTHPPPPSFSASTNTKTPDLTSFAYTPSLTQYVQAADVVISHAGAGSILETLALSKPLVVVVNSTLMHDHQSELAYALRDRACCRVVTNPNISSHLLPAIQASLTEVVKGTKPIPPPRQSGIIASLVASELCHARPSSLPSD